MNGCIVFYQCFIVLFDFIKLFLSLEKLKKIDIDKTQYLLTRLFIFVSFSKLTENDQIGTNTNKTYQYMLTKMCMFILIQYHAP